MSSFLSLFSKKPEKIQLEYKILEVMHELGDLEKNIENNNMSAKNFSEILKKNEESVIEKLTSNEITIGEQLANDKKTIETILQRILKIKSYIDEKEKQQRQGGTKKNKKSIRKTQKKNKVLK